MKLIKVIRATRILASTIDFGKKNEQKKRIQNVHYLLLFRFLHIVQLKRIQSATSKLSEETSENLRTYIVLNVMKLSEVPHESIAAVSNAKRKMVSMIIFRYFVHTHAFNGN